MSDAAKKRAKLGDVMMDLDYLIEEVRECQSRAMQVRRDLQEWGYPADSFVALEVSDRLDEARRMVNGLYDSVDETFDELNGDE